MSERITVVNSLGVLAFDGEVIESFGYSLDRPMRAHVAMLEKIDVDEGGRFSDPGVTFKAKGQPYSPHAHLTQEEAASPEVTKLIEAVRAAAPNLEGS